MDTNAFQKAVHDNLTLNNIHLPKDIIYFGKRGTQLVDKTMSRVANITSQEEYNAVLNKTVDGVVALTQNFEVVPERVIKELTAEPRVFATQTLLYCVAVFQMMKVVSESVQEGQYSVKH